MHTGSVTAQHPFDQERLFVGVRPRLLRLARLRGVAPDALEDVVQETLLVAWKKIDTLDAPEHAQRWLDEICRTICLRYLRASSQDASRRLPFSDLLVSSELSDLSELEETLAINSPGAQVNDPAEVFSHEDLLQLLRQALNLLPEQAREAVEMYYLCELPQREAAVRLGLSISALETRLHRARQQLRQILNGDLRAQAASFDLPLDGEEPALGWRASGVWCYYCGQQHLHGSFETLPDGQKYLRMRCPGCSQSQSFDIVNGKGLVSVERLRSFQPAFKRTMRGISRHLLQAVTSGEIACKSCGKLAPVAVGDFKQESASTSALQQRFWIRGECQHCGNSSVGCLCSADDVVYWSHPVIQAFIQRHPRWLNQPDRPIEYRGQPAILFHLADRVSAAQLDVIADQQTLRVLTTLEK